MKITCEKLLLILITLLPLMNAKADTVDDLSFEKINLVPKSDSEFQFFDYQEDQYFDVGDIQSKGIAGRQLHIRELLSEEVGRDWKFFPPHSQLPETYPDPTPPSPAQDSLYLSEGMPLVVVIPQLQHKPFFAMVEVDYNLDGNVLTVDASMHLGLSSTDTIYGPHEYLLSIGELPVGNYRLDLILTRTSDYGPGEQTTTGFANFDVFSIPEPSMIGLTLIGLISSFAFVRIER